jgi:hypothetical protein
MCRVCEVAVPLAARSLSGRAEGCGEMGFPPGWATHLELLYFSTFPRAQKYLHAQRQK